MSQDEKVIDILLVEDSETDAELTLQALKQGKLRNTVHHVQDGVEAMKFLRKEGEYANEARPDLVLLDLNMPKLDGREVLKQIRQHPTLKVIPVVVLTTSNQDQDILQTYGLAANSYIVKPVDLNSFFEVVRQISNFWVKVVALPPKADKRSNS
jgi:CheY-like chemotaxis protein